jgi:hypothetical protein
MTKLEADKILKWTRRVNKIILTYGDPVDLSRASLENDRRRHIDSIIHWFTGMIDLPGEAKKFEGSFKIKDRELSNKFTRWLKAAKEFSDVLLDKYWSIKLTNSKNELSILFGRFSIERRLLDKATRNIALYIFENYPIRK